jgi:hypothetical protein
MKPKEYTKDEVRKLFLDHCSGILEYWLKSDRAPSTREKMEGFMFSVFAAIDGAAVDLPAFMLVPFPCKEDKAFSVENGENWFPYTDQKKVNCDIAGSLHDQWGKYMKAEPGQTEDTHEKV